MTIALRKLEPYNWNFITGDLVEKAANNQYGMMMRGANTGCRHRHEECWPFAMSSGRMEEKIRERGRAYLPAARREKGISPTPQDPCAAGSVGATRTTAVAEQEPRW
jgi:hypothetical protein